VSQTPVREAILKLVSEGVMIPVPTRGFQLVELSDAELAELAWIRALLEPPAIRVTAERATQADLQPFDRLLDLMDVATEQADFREFFELDRTFHLELIRLSGRDQLLAVVEQLRDRTLRYGIAASTANARGLHQLLDEHRGLLAHIKNHDGDAAAALLYDHILGSLARDLATANSDGHSGANTAGDSSDSASSDT
jgi:DNA-binding GntR family transcriptional regulator